MSFRASLRRAWPVLVAYGVFSMWGVTCLVASLALTSGGFGVAPGNIGVLFGVVVATAVGHVGGNLLGLVRLRLYVVVAAFLAGFVLAALSGVALGAFALFLVVGVLAALGGYLGVASRLDVVAAWFPLSFAVGGAIVWMNAHGAVSTFRGGAKHALWDPFTILCLAGAVFLMLVFLATRQSLGLTVWQEVGRPPPASGGSDDAVGIARPGRGSIVVLLAFAIVVLGATALISPYLFRTRQAENGETGGQGQKDDGKGKGGEKQKGKGNGGPKGDDGKGNDGRRGPKGNDGKGDGSGGDKAPAHGKGDGDGASPQKGDDPPPDPLGKPDPEHAGKAASEALGLGLRLMAWTLALAAALFFLAIILVPPIRRAFLLRHLERPLWPVSPTSRVMNLWRRALAALAMMEVSPGSGEAPRDFARRAEGELAAQGCAAPGLGVAAAIVEKVDYAGRGLGAGEEQAMRDAVTALLGAVAPRVGIGKKMAAAWGPAPEVEP